MDININKDTSSIFACYLVKTVTNDITYFKAQFPRAHWAFFWRIDYEDAIDSIGTDISRYKSESSVPKYGIYKDGIKLGNAYPRISESDSKFLYIPKTYTKKDRANRRRPKYKILREYYIYDINDNYEINEKDAKLLFYQ